MKKLFLVIALAAGFSVSSFAKETYKINDSAVDQMFAQSTDITFTTASDNDLVSTATSSEAGFTAVGGGGESKGGYLLRCFFCGWIALHRSYMGGKNLWWKYLLGNLCFGLGGIVVAVDFWGPIFSDSFWNKYKGNNKYIIFLGK